MCTDTVCSDNKVYTDLWMSADMGETWAVQTMGIFANTYLNSMFTEYSKGIGRHYSAVLTGDDTIYILGGHKPNTTEGLNSVFTSSVNSPDATFSSAPYLISPKGVVYKSATQVAIFFKENIQMGTGTGAELNAV